MGGDPLSLATCLEALKAAARRDAEKIDEDILIGKDLKRLTDTIAERHYLQPLRLHNAVVGVPRAAVLGVAGEPGLEEPGGGHIPVPATRVDLFVPLDGIATLALLDEACGGLDLAGAEIDVAEKRLVVGYVSEHPNAAAANEFFDRCLTTIEGEAIRVSEQVQEFNQGLALVIGEALEAAKGRAKARRKFAAGLEQPRTFDRWGGPA